MEKETKNDQKTENDYQWYYIIVQNPGSSDEQFMGYKDKETDQSFIPAFKTKEEAQQCFLMMPKDAIHNKYEVQAIIDDDLVSQAAKNGFSVFLMDDKSSVKRQLG